MINDKKIMVWTHWDLDGIVSYLTVRWAFPKYNIEYIPTTVQNFREHYTKWLLTHNIEDYETVFIMDLGVFNDKDLIDHNNIFIIDHHKGHDNNTYSKALTVILEYPSACKLAYKVFIKLFNLKITNAQKHLIILANDYDSYALTLPDSYNLNTIFWGINNNKFESFIKAFINGFNGFTVEQENIIKLHANKIKTIKENLKVYGGNVEIQGNSYYVCSTFSTECINEVSDILLNDYNADVSIIININSNHVSYRRSVNTVDLAKLAYDLADGYGHEYSSGSGITDTFIEFTKKLTEQNDKSKEPKENKPKAGRPKGSTNSKKKKTKKKKTKKKAKSIKIIKAKN